MDMDAQDIGVLQNSIENILVPADRKICTTKHALVVRIETDHPCGANSMACHVAQSTSKRLNHVEHGEAPAPRRRLRLTLMRLDIDSQDGRYRSRTRHKTVSYHAKGS